MSTDEEIQLALGAVSAIGKIVDAVRDAKAGKLDPKVALDAIAKMHDALVSNDAAADTALDAKFEGK